jgi:hypothetical protein
MRDFMLAVALRANAYFLERPAIHAALIHQVERESRGFSGRRNVRF